MKPHQRHIEGKGAIKVIKPDVAEPFTTELSLVVPAGKMWRVISLALRVVTSAVVGNRDLQIHVDTGVDNQNLWIARTNTTQAAGLGLHYQFGSQTQVGDIGSGNRAGQFADQCIYLLPGHRIRSVLFTRDAGDTMDRVNLLVEEFPYYAD